MVSDWRGSRVSPSVLRAAAIGVKDPGRVRTMPDAVQALPGLFYRGGLQRWAERGMPVWMRQGTPAAGVEANERGVLRGTARQEEEEWAQPEAERSKESVRRPGEVAGRTARGVEEGDPLPTGELRAAGGQRDRGATGESGGDFGDAGQRKETAQPSAAAASGSNNTLVA